MPLQSRIAVISNDALGNYVVATPLIQMLRTHLSPVLLHYYGGTRTKELWSMDPHIDRGFPLFGSKPSDSLRQIGADYDLVVNMEDHCLAKCFAAVAGSEAYLVGPSMSDDGRSDLPQSDDEVGRLAADRDWTSPDLTDRYPFLKTPHISEIFCRLCYLAGPVPSYSIPSKAVNAPIPDVLISTAASLESKLWREDRWRQVVHWMKGEGLSIGVLGAKPAEQRRFWRGDSVEDRLVDEGQVVDLRGAFTLPEVVGALEATRLALTIDNGILHLACATSTQVVGLFRHGIHRLWAPAVPNLTVIPAGEGSAVSEIGLATVQEAIRCALAKS